MHHATSRTSFLFSIGTLLLAALLLWMPSEAQAQIIFDMQLSERAQEMVTDPDRMAPEELTKIVGEHGIVTYRGERPVEARFLAFFLPREGERIKQADLGRFELRPGEHRAGEFLPRERFLALFEEMFPDTHFAAKELDFFPDDFFFPCSIFDPEGRDFAAKDLVFDRMEIGKGETGFVLAVHPEHDDVEREEVQIRPMGFVFGSRD